MMAAPPGLWVAVPVERLALLLNHVEFDSYDHPDGPMLSMESRALIEEFRTRAGIPEPDDRWRPPRR